LRAHPTVEVQDAAGGLAAEQVQADEPSDVLGGRAPRDKGCGAVLHDPTAVTGASCDAAAAWRGAFLAHVALTGRGGAARLQVSSPGPEAALALVGAARRLGVAAKTKQVGRADLVVVSDGGAIEALLGWFGDLLPPPRAPWRRVGWPALWWRSRRSDTVSRTVQLSKTGCRPRSGTSR